MPFKEKDPNRLLDADGTWHCMGCGRFLPRLKLRTPKPTFLCRWCQYDNVAEQKAQWAAKNRLEKAMAQGRLLVPRGRKGWKKIRDL